MYKIFCFLILVSSSYIAAQSYSFDLDEISRQAFPDDKYSVFSEKNYGEKPNASFKKRIFKKENGIIDSVIITYNEDDSEIRWSWYFKDISFRRNQHKLILDSSVIFITDLAQIPSGKPKYKKSTIYLFSNGLLEDEWPSKGLVFAKDKIGDAWKIFANTDLGIMYFRDTITNRLYSGCSASVLDTMATHWGFPPKTFDQFKIENIFETKHRLSYSVQDTINIMGYRKQLSDSTYALVEMENCDVSFMGIYKAASIAINEDKKYIRYYRNSGQNSLLCDTLGCLDIDYDGNIRDGENTRTRTMASYNKEIHKYCDEDFITNEVSAANLPDTLFCNSDSIYTYREKQGKRKLSRLVKQLNDTLFAEAIFWNIAQNECQPSFINTYFWKDKEKMIETVNGTKLSEAEGDWSANYCYGDKCVEITNKVPKETLKEDKSKVLSNRKCPFEKKINAFETKMHFSGLFKNRSKILKTYINDNKNENVESVIKKSPKDRDGYLWKYEYQFYDNCDIASVDMLKIDPETDEVLEEKAASLRNDSKNTLHFVCDEQKSGIQYRDGLLQKEDNCSCYDKNGKFSKRENSIIGCFDDEDIEKIRGGSF